MLGNAYRRLCQRPRGLLAFGIGLGLSASLLACRLPLPRSCRPRRRRIATASSQQSKAEKLRACSEWWQQCSAKGLDDPNQLEGVCKFGLLAHANFATPALEPAIQRNGSWLDLPVGRKSLTGIVRL
jgi:hypothetical protein